MHDLWRLHPVHYQDATGLCRRALLETGDNLRVERIGAFLDRVGATASAGLQAPFDHLRFCREQHRTVGQETMRPEAVQCQEVLPRDPINARLVSQAGVEEAVGYDPSPSFNGRNNDGGAMLGPGGGKQQGLGPRHPAVRLRRVQKQGPHCLSAGSSAWLACGDDLQAAAAKKLCQ